MLRADRLPRQVKAFEVERLVRMEGRGHDREDAMEDGGGGRDRARQREEEARKLFVASSILKKQSPRNSNRMLLALVSA